MVLTTSGRDAELATELVKALLAGYERGQARRRMWKAEPPAQRRRMLTDHDRAQIIGWNQDCWTSQALADLGHAVQELTIMLGLAPPDEPAAEVTGDGRRHEALLIDAIDRDAQTPKAANHPKTAVMKRVAVRLEDEGRNGRVERRRVDRHASVTRAALVSTPSGPWPSHERQAIRFLASAGLSAPGALHVLPFYHRLVGAGVPGRAFLACGAAPPTCRTRRVLHRIDTQWAVRPELRGVWHPRAA